MEQEGPRPHWNFLCLIFGHKFNHNTLDRLRATTDFCTRCGMKPWQPKRKNS